MSIKKNTNLLEHIHTLKYTTFVLKQLKPGCLSGSNS